MKYEHNGYTIHLDSDIVFSARGINYYNRQTVTDKILSLPFLHDSERNSMKHYLATQIAGEFMTDEMIRSTFGYHARVTLSNRQREESERERAQREKEEFYKKFEYMCTLSFPNGTTTVIPVDNRKLPAEIQGTGEIHRSTAIRLLQLIQHAENGSPYFEENYVFSQAAVNSTISYLMSEGIQTVQKGIVNNETLAAAYRSVARFNKSITY